MVDAVSSQGGFPTIQPTTGQAKAATSPEQGQQTQASAAGDTTANLAADGLEGLVDGDLTNDQALTKSQAAGQQLANSGLSIANRSPQALANALPG